MFNITSNDSKIRDPIKAMNALDVKLLFKVLHVVYH